MSKRIPHLDLEERLWDGVHLLELVVNSNPPFVGLTVCGRPASRAMSEKVSCCELSDRAKGECVAAAAGRVSDGYNCPPHLQSTPLLVYGRGDAGGELVDVPEGVGCTTV